MQDVFIIGSKGLGNYGGYETFVMKLVDYHSSNQNIRYHIACKANGTGCMNEKKLPGAKTISPHHFNYRNAICYKVPVKEQFKSAQAIFYDIDALKWAINHIKKHHIEHPIVYVLACRIGPFFGKYVKEIHKLGGRVFVNPDGHEWMRAKWSAPVRKYWKESERGMVKYADLLVCDSVNIEKYIKEEYGQYKPKTTFIAYGADVVKSELEDTDPVFTGWLKEQGLKPYQYYYCCGRFVPENNFETMIREFMKSKTKRDFAIITTKNDAFLNELDEKLGFKKDPRIKFVGTVYNQELLKKIREQAYAYFHGHSVGGTNPSLLEALGSTRLNLLFDVGFNKEVGQDAALYWSKKDGDLAGLIDRVDGLMQKNREQHMRVLKSLAAFYRRLPELPEPKRHYIARCAAQIVENQFQIDISLGNHLGMRKKLKAWDRKLLRECPEIYHSTERKSITLLRATDYRLLPIGWMMLEIKRNLK